jgi:hypothetical protein
MPQGLEIHKENVSEKMKKIRVGAGCSAFLSYPRRCYCYMSTDAHPTQHAKSSTTNPTPAIPMETHSAHRTSIAQHIASIAEDRQTQSAKRVYY